MTDKKIQHPRSTIRKSALFAVVFVSIVAGALFQQKTVSAASLANWDPGNIITDDVFANSSSMNEGQIQSFLNSKVTNCTNGYVCLKNYTQNGKSSAKIIAESANEFRINPQVLLALLQKESGLITSTTPSSISYRSATGYACPDTAACDSQYYGLTNQLRSAARMFRKILDNVPQNQWYTPYVVGNNFIRYSPDASCGGSNVFIRNRATQALYNYTPYQPNPGALAAGYGQASCGAYGNRNFYHFFNDWFGSSISRPTYNWELTSQQVVIGGVTRNTNLVTLNPGTTATLVVKVKNTSNQTWYNFNTNFGTTRPYDRSSTYADGWIASNRAGSLQEGSVMPGEVGTFQFNVTAPNKISSSREYFNVLTEGMSWHNDIGFYYDINVIQPTGEYYNASIQAYDLYTDEARTKNISASYNNVIRGSTLYGSVKFTNTGNNTLSKSFTLLGTSSPRDRLSTFKHEDWFSNNRVVRINEDSVAPGQQGTILFSLKVPMQTGWYTETYGLVAEGKSWMDYDKASFAINVTGNPQSVLSSNNLLGVGNQLMNTNMTHRLILQGDGNLVLYRNNIPLWASNTSGARNPQLLLQNDGNLVLYAEGGRAIWNSGTVGSQKTLVLMQNDGNMVIYNENNTPRWSAGTNNK